MRVVLTGATSFTGAWFARALADAGHDVLAVVRGPEGSYSGLRAERLASLKHRCAFVWDAPFGSPSFMGALDAAGSVDVLCHHAARVSGYRSPHFDVVGAVVENTRELPAVIERLSAAGCRRLVLTGSVFERGEGAGTAPLRAFSGYAVSKGVTAEIAAHWAAQAGWGFGKFVIANPFGPWEEARFLDYLLRAWVDRAIPRVATPDYVRDNIHVDLLARAYAEFVSSMPAQGWRRHNPSGYVESQGSFAKRVAAEMRSRLDLPCKLDLGQQTAFDEPSVRINTDILNGQAWGWREAAAWDRLGDYYRDRYLRPMAGDRA